MSSWKPKKTARFLVLATFILLPLLSAPADAQPGAYKGKQLTVERIYSPPSLEGALAEGLEWSPDGNLLSYFAETKDGTELWAIDATTGERRRLVSAEKLASLLAPEAPPTQRTGLGRVTPQRYFWSPPGDALLFPWEKKLVWFALNTQTARTLESAGQPIADPKISPNGRWVSFLRGWDLWVVNVASGEEKQLTRGGREELRNGQLDWVYPEELDLHTAHWWSPDSTRIAFLQMDERPVTRYPLVDLLSYTGEIDWMRYPKTGGANPIVRVGVVSLAGGEPRWIDAGRNEHYIARVAWLPGGKRLAIERLDRPQKRLDLLLADPDSGQAKVVLAEEDKYWMNLSDGLYWFSDGQRFLWSSERAGYRHLYLCDLDGKLPRQLTRGDWEVSSLAGVDEKQGLVYFVSTNKSVLERQLYRVSLAGGEPALITSEAGTHKVTMAPGSHAYFDEHSTVLTPPRQDLYRADGTRLAVIDADSLPELAEYQLSPAEFLTVPADDGTPLNAMLIKPPDFDPSRRYPVLLYVYGGPGVQLVRNEWGGKYFLWQELMAQKGFISFALDNRGSLGRGHAFETPLYHHFGSVELVDQLASVRYLRSLPYVDGSRIGIWGGSYGGHMTLHAMLRAPNIFKAGFARAPVTDWRQYDTIYTERYMGTPKENPEGYQLSSPVTYAAELRGKLLIAHGTGDDNVHLSNSIEFVEQLIRAGRYAEIMIVPGRGHSISDPQARIEMFRRATEFFLHSLEAELPGAEKRPP